MSASGDRCQIPEWPIRGMQRHCPIHPIGKTRRFSQLRKANVLSAIAFPAQRTSEPAVSDVALSWVVRENSKSDL